MEFGEMKRTTSNWSNFCMLLRRVGLSASAGLSCLNWVWSLFRCNVSLLIYIFMQKKEKIIISQKWWFTFVDFPSVLRYCWLGLLTCKNRLPYNLYCVGGDVKHCTVQSNPIQYWLWCERTFFVEHFSKTAHMLLLLSLYCCSELVAWWKRIVSTIRQNRICCFSVFRNQNWYWNHSRL